ncbi:TPA: hypothetical protein ACTXE0_004595 [Klebsiella michiganensis]
MALRIPGHDFVNGRPLTDFNLFHVMNTNPFKDGLIGSYFLGKKNADPTYNFANPELPLAVHGSPDISDPRFAKLSRSTGYFDTQIASSTEQTIIVLGRQQQQPQVSVFVSNYLKVDATNVTGDTVMTRWRTDATSEVVFYAQTSLNGVTSVARNNIIPADSFGVFGGLIASSLTAIGAWSMNETTAPGYQPINIPGRVASQRSLLIGCSYSDTEFLSPASVSAVLIYSNDIKGEPMANVMNWLRNRVGVEAGIWSAPKG